jgi:hypothetical protein
MSDVPTINCVYCGHQYAPGTPATHAEVLKEHIEQCEAHPMSKLKKRYDILFDIAVGMMIGVAIQRGDKGPISAEALAKKLNLLIDEHKDA